jgi:kinesin family member 18/19
VDPSSYADETVPWLDLREDPIKGPCVAGVAEHEVEGAADVMNLLIEGNKRRTQEPTAANKESSRSHAVLQILIQTKERYSTQYSVGKFSLIDLAGSERAANTQNRGIRLLEGANINRSLLALGNCITALVQGKGSFVPYRDSK